MKKLSNVVLLFAIVASLSACDADSVRTASSKDLGSLTLGNGYTLHGFTVGANNFTDRVYFLEKDGIPVQGTTAAEQSGKTTKYVATAVPTNGGPSAVPLSINCNGLEDCKAKVSAMEKTQNDAEQALYEKLRLKYEASPKQ